MNWVEISDLSGKKEWHSDEPGYKVTWTDNVAGVPTRPHYHALVDCDTETYPCWSFAGRRGPYYSLTQAQKAADRHKKTWDRAVRILTSARKGRIERLEQLKGKAKVGKGVTLNRLLSLVPRSVQESQPEVVLRRLIPSKRKSKE